MTDPLDDMDLNETTKDILRAIKADVEDAYLARLRELEAEVAHLKGERKQGWPVAPSHITDYNNIQMHLIKAISQISRNSGHTDSWKRQLLRACSSYTQWLEDELWRYQHVPEDLHNEWDEEAVRDLAAGKVKMHPEEDAAELAKALKLTLQLLDYARQGSKMASDVATELGQRNLKLREDEAHWREHCRRVDHIVGQCLIPDEDEGGNLIFTENRVVMLIKMLTTSVTNPMVLGTIPDIYRGDGGETDAG